MFIVQSGLLNVQINNADGSTLSLKHVRRGESVTSLLSFIDVLAVSVSGIGRLSVPFNFHLLFFQGNESYYKSVTAKALEPSLVIRLPMQALKDIFDENPDILVRVVQVIMIRLQRVIFTALRNYLGLNSELVQPRMSKDKRMSVAPTTTTSTAAMSSSIPIPSSAPIPISKGSPTHYKRFDKDYIHTLSTETIDLSRPDMLNDLSEHSLPKHNRRVSILVDRDQDVTTLYTFAIDGFLKELGLKESDRSLLEESVEFKEAESGITMLCEGCEEVCYDQPSI